MDFIQFSYSKDSELTEISIESIFKNVKNVGKVVVFNDLNSPIDKNIIEKSKSKFGHNVLFVNTNWDRNGNLIGQKHFFSYVKMLKILKEKEVLKSNTIIKLDPDTIILKDNLLNTFDSSKNIIGGDFMYSEWYPIGPCYYFKSELIEKLIWSINHYYVSSEKEDVEFGRRAIYLANKFDLRIPTSEIPVDNINFVDFRKNLTEGILFSSYKTTVDIIKDNNIEIFSAGLDYENGKDKEIKNKQLSCLKEILTSI